MFTFLDGMLNFQHIIDQLNNIEIIIICSCFSVEGNLVSSMPLYEKKEDRWLNVLKNKEAKFFRHHYGDWNVWVYNKYYNSFKCFELVRKRECHHYCHKISLQYWRPQPVHDYDFFFNIHLLMIAPVYETCIVITICTDYSLCDHWNVAWMKEKL